MYIAVETSTQIQKNMKLTKVSSQQMKLDQSTPELKSSQKISKGNGSDVVPASSKHSTVKKSAQF